MNKETFQTCFSEKFLQIGCPAVITKSAKGEQMSEWVGFNVPPDTV